MRTGEMIVTYREISKAISNNEAATGKELKGAVGDPVESAQMLTSFNIALKYLQDAEKTPGVLIAPDHRVASLLLTYLANEADASRSVDIPMGGKEAKFDSNDWLGWAGSFFTWWRKIRKHDLIAAPCLADTIDDRARIAILGDWGTGLYGAPVCAQSIARDAQEYDLTIHLGDVYYSGTENEVQERFLDIWPRKAPLNRAINSNHEMYSGGHGYFKRTLKEFGQAASYFALQNSHWLLVGLDTAYEDHDLAGDQVEWLQEILKTARDRGVVLISHHQPFSWFEKGGTKLVAKLGGLLTTQKIFAWYWGHEHRCVLYDKHPIWGLYGRTVGHSGFPYFRDKLDGLPEADLPRWHALERANLAPGGMVLDGPNEYIKGHEAKYGPNGYMSLELDGAHLNEIVHAADGSVLYDRQLV